jgi:hypothetical protein
MTTAGFITGINQTTTASSRPAFSHETTQTLLEGPTSTSLGVRSERNVLSRTKRFSWFRGWRQRGGLSVRGLKLILFGGFRDLTDDERRVFANNAAPHRRR